jgi:RNA polymerase sigma-70 factor (ECF subfamily)
MVGGDRYKAEDIVQETLLRYWRKRGAAEGSPLNPWLFTVARNLVIDGYRMRMARPQEVAGEVWLDQKADDVDYVDSMLSSVVVDSALQDLSPAHRQVLYATYFAGRTVKEASEALGIPVGTVKSRLYYGVRALQASLEQRGITTSDRTAVSMAA